MINCAKKAAKLLLQVIPIYIETNNDQENIINIVCNGSLWKNFEIIKDSFLNELKIVKNYKFNMIFVKNSQSFGAATYGYFKYTKNHLNQFQIQKPILDIKQMNKILL